MMRWPSWIPWPFPWSKRYVRRERVAKAKAGGVLARFKLREAELELAALSKLVYGDNHFASLIAADMRRGPMRQRGHPGGK